MATVNPVDWRKRRQRVAVSLKIVSGTTRPGYQKILKGMPYPILRFSAHQ